MTRRKIQPSPMRWLWAWIVAMAMALPALGGVTGRISSIGFQSYVRIDDWVPLVIQTTSDEPAPHTFDLQVVQTDLDGDEVVYTRTGLTINPGTQTFRTYFRPETVNGGLPASGSDTSGELGQRLRIFLFDPATRKRAVRVAVSGAAPQALETGPLTTNAGQKLILIVGRSPAVRELVPGSDRVVGLAETCYFVQIDPNRLPESALAYGAVDALVWTDADSAKLAPAQLRALRQYVQGGGTLVVIQNADMARVAKFDDLLPVKLGRSMEWLSPEPLQSILSPRGTPPPRDRNGRAVDPWRNAIPPFRMHEATPADDTTLVDAWTAWPDGHRTPLIARRLFGLGCVAWLAEDISEPSLATVDFGWPRLWERLMDWHAADLKLTAAETQREIELLKAKHASESARDVGVSFGSKQMDHEGRTAALLSLTFVFFIGYWALAGPVSYGVLAAKRRVDLSWFVYGAVAAVAAVLTVFIAQVVLRGAPTAKHVSLVRVRGGSGEPGRVLSRVGVYLPKDTNAVVSLPQTPDAPPAAITPFGPDPRYDTRTVSPRDSSYAVAVGADVDQKTVDVAIPFRSTLKKMQADWTGPVTGGISGRAKLLPGDPPIEGRVSNDTNADLRDVIMVFRAARQARGDLVIAVPDWKKGQTLELKSLWQSGEFKLAELPSKRFGLHLFGADKVVRGNWTDAVTWLQDDFRTPSIGLSQTEWDDSDRGFGRSFPIVSLFDRCPPMTNFANDGSRVDLQRRGVRPWDASPAVAAGAMVVLARTSAPLPLPLTVDGDTSAGEGPTFYQAIVPIDRSAFNAADAAAGEEAQH